MTSQEQFEQDGAQQWLIEYPLDSASVVFDVGGYLGEWTWELLRRDFGICSHCGGRQNPKVFVFEPISAFVEECTQRFHDFPKVEILPFALGNCDRPGLLAIKGAASNEEFDQWAQVAEIHVRDITQFCYDRGIDRIDLISINIEGGEYALLARMIETDLIRICRNVQVQFHDIDPSCALRRKHLQRRLGLTHELKWEYPFVWESWVREQ